MFSAEREEQAPIFAHFLFAVFLQDFPPSLMLADIASHGPACISETPDPKARIYQKIRRRSELAPDEGSSSCRHSYLGVAGRATRHKSLLE